MESRHENLLRDLARAAMDAERLDWNPVAQVDFAQLLRLAQGIVAMQALRHYEEHINATRGLMVHKTKVKELKENE